MDGLVFGWRSALLLAALAPLVPIGIGLVTTLRNRIANRTLAALLLVWLPDWGPVALSVPGAHEQAADLGRELLGRSMLIFQSAGLTILTAMVAATMVAIVPNAEQRK